MRWFTDFSALETYLHRLGHFRINPDMGRIKTVLNRLGLQRPPFVVAQVAGTNGKGSTSTMLASLCRAHGHVTGLYTSPHFVSFRERARINGRMLPEPAWLEQAERLMAVGGEELTYFELLTVLAAMLFAAQGVDVAVMETGLGGTWDAVTAFEAELVAFTPISLDHCHILGETVTAIASDKSGAIRLGRPVVSAPQPVDVLQVLQQRATERGAPITLSDRNILPPDLVCDPDRMALSGSHQLDNAALALQSWRLLAASQGWDTDPAAEERGLSTARIAGRLQYVPPSVRWGHPSFLLDGAHNNHGMAVLGEELARRNIAPAAVIFACLEDKDPDAVAAQVRILSTGPIFVPPIPDNPRSIGPEILARRIGLAACPVSSMAEALTRAAAHVRDYLPDQAAKHPERHPVLICGSLYMLGDFYHQRPDCLEDPV